jgi:hypothetical protein
MFSLVVDRFRAEVFRSLIEETIIKAFIFCDMHFHCFLTMELFSPTQHYHKHAKFMLSPGNVP